MYIRLPEKFMYTQRRSEDYAFVKNGKLFITGHVDYENLMYQLTYVVKGYDRCYYCGVQLTPNTRTIDHLFPRKWGGISIPENMVPACNRCNSQKKEMTVEQYQIWKKIKDGKEKRAFYIKCIEENEQYLKSKKFILPDEWVSMYDISELIKHINFDRLEMGKNQKVYEHYQEYNQYPRPIIMSNNDWVLRGRHILFNAKLLGQKEVPAVIIQNAIVKSCLI